MIKKLSVIGAGQMGSGIAQVAAQIAAQIAKIPQVILYDQRYSQLNSQIDKMKESLERSKQKGFVTSDEIEMTMSAIKPTTKIDDLGESDFFIEVTDKIKYLFLIFFRQ